MPWTRYNSGMVKRMQVCAAGLAACLILAGAGPAAGSILYVGDGSLSGVATFNVTGGVATVLGTSVPPFGSGGPMFPQGMAIGPDGMLYVADENNGTVDAFNGATGQYMSTLLTGLFEPTGMALGPDGNLYVAESPMVGGLGPFGAVAEFSLSGSSLGYFLAPNAAISGNPGLILSPDGLTFGPDGALYIADPGSGTVVRATAGGASTFTGYVGGNSYMSNPFQPAFGPDGNLYVTDVTGGVVYEFNGSTGAFLGVLGLSLVQPTGLAFHGGNMYVADGMGRVAAFDSGGNELADLVSYPNLIGPEYLQFSDTTPEPSTLGLLGLGLLSMGAAWKRSRAGRGR